MYTLIGLIWLAISIIISVKWYNRLEKNVIRLGSPIKRLLHSIWDWFLYFVIALLIVAILMAILLGVLFAWGWIIGLVAVLGIIIWILLRKRH